MYKSDNGYTKEEIMPYLQDMSVLMICLWSVEVSGRKIIDRVFCLVEKMATK